MQLTINQEQIETAIKEQLEKNVRDGVSYRIKDALDKAIAEAITPEVVQGYAAAAVAALTDPVITQQIVTEMQAAIAEACRVTMQEAVVNVAARLRGYMPNRSKEDEARVSELRERLFPRSNT